MHAFQPETFAALSPAKAKAAALALFDAAMIEPAADWRGVAFALHSVVSRKRGAAAGPISDDIAMQDAADASEFAAWADYPATGKAASIARGRVTVTFADGWSKTVGMLAGKTAKGRKPWSIAHAVRFAVICYKIAAVRRATGDDGAIYFDKGGNASGETITLDGLICAPEIVSVISAESAETVAGDLVWNPEEANAFTRDQRAGAVTVSNAYGPHTLDASRAIYAARGDLLARLGLAYVASYALAKAAVERVEALLWPSEIVSRSRYDFDCFASVIEAEPAAYPWDADMVRDFTDSPGLAQMAGFTPDVADAPEPVDASHDDADAPAYDGDALAAALKIVGAFDDGDAFGRWLSPSTWSDRRITVEDALMAWPAREETPLANPDNEDAPDAYEIAALAAGWRIGPAGKWTNPSSNSGASYPDTPRAFRYICEDHGLMPSADAAPEPHSEPLALVEPEAAPMVAEMPAAPASKPRYRYSPISGAWDIVPPADAMPLAA
jgi:hypothetical protein